MNKTIVPLLVALVVATNHCLASASDSKTLPAKLDVVPGYAGIPFGAPFPSSRFQLEENRGAVKVYTKKGQHLQMGPASLDAVLYYAFQGKFYGVAFHTKDGEDSMELGNVLTSAFGKGKKESQGGPSISWSGNKVGLLYEVNTSTGEGNAFLFDESIHDSVLSEQAASAQSAALKLIQGN